MAEAKTWLTGLETAEVTFYRLGGRAPEPSKGDVFGGYAVRLQKPLADEKIVNTLRGVLINPKAYGGLPASCFSPGMGFRFKAGNQEADLLICLECSRMQASKGDKGYSWTLTKEGGARLLRVYDAIVTEPIRFSEEAKAWLDGLEKAELTFFKIGPAEVPGAVFHDYPISFQKSLKDEGTGRDLRALLVDPKTYDERAIKCFEPGMGFRFKDGADESDLVICLSCRAIHAHKGTETKYWLLGEEGVARLRKIYDAQVPAEPKK